MEKRSPSPISGDNNRESERSVHQTIALVGLMGAGKSTVGRRLAGRLGLPFVDADEEIEAAAGMSITDIFETLGEDAFRDGERRVIARLLNDPPHILATGGGAFMDPETRDAIRQKTISVWLKADIELLMSRVSRRNNRPLLAEGDPRETMERLIAERYPIYAEADISVNAGDGSQEDVAERIVAELSRQQKQGSAL